MREEQTNPPRENPEACLDRYNFARDWEDWKASLRETVGAAREADPSEGHLLDVTEDMLEFINGRICPGSPEEKLVSAVRRRAGPGEIKALARVFLRLLEDDRAYLRPRSLWYSLSFSLSVNRPLPNVPMAWAARPTPQNPRMIRGQGNPSPLHHHMAISRAFTRMKKVRWV